MIFNGIKKDYLTVTRGRKRPAWAPIERGLITVTGMAGAHLSESKTQIRQIDVPVFILADSFSDLQKLKEDMAAWLIHDEPKELSFKDELDRTYYAVVDDGLDLDELVRWGTGTITFLCPDPYKYGPEKTLPFTADIVKITNEGTAEAEPIFELTAKKKATFAMISKGDDDEDSEYNLIGEPADDDVRVVDEKEKIYEIDGLSGWSSSGIVSDSRFPDISGTMQYDEVGFRVSNYGSGEGIHGPALIRELDVTTQDFEVDAIFDIISEREIEAWRIEVKLLDESMKEIGIIGVKDNNAYKKLRVGLGRYGAYRGNGQRNGYLIGDDNYSREFGNNASIQMRFSRKGNEIAIQAGRRYINHLYNVERERYIDSDNLYQGKLKYIQIMIGTYGSRVQPSRLRINKLDVYKLNKIERDDTPYILYPGDKITFDHKNEEVLVNGEFRPDLMGVGMLGSSFFKLKKGKNILAVTPEDTFDTKVIYSNKYL